MWRRATISAWLIAAALSCPAAVPLQDDPPVAAGPKAGAIVGRITPAELVRADTLRAVSRVSGASFPPASFDAKTGEFRFVNIPGGQAWDICFATTDGRDYEGIDLEFVGARLDRLAQLRRKSLGLSGRDAKKPPAKFLAQDARAIEKFVQDWQDFLDTRRVLYIQGQGQRATLLVELMRTRDFHKSRQAGGPGQVVWRVELWYMRKQGGGWARLANVERLLRRRRCSLAELQRSVAVEYYPQLSASLNDAGQAKPIRFAIPDIKNPDPTRGRPAKAKLTPKTKPHILGMEK